MYLEWAPENIINGNLHKKVGSILAIGGEQVKRAALEEQLIHEDADLDSTEVDCVGYIFGDCVLLSL